MTTIQKILYRLLRATGFKESPVRLLHTTIKEMQEGGPEYITQVAFGRDLFRFFMHGPTLNCIVDESGRFVLVSDNWEQALGYSKKEMYNRNFLSFVHPDDLLKTVEVFEKDKREGNDQYPKAVFSNRYIGKDGRILNLDWHRVGIIEGDPDKRTIGAAIFVGYEEDRKDLRE